MSLIPARFYEWLTETAALLAKDDAAAERSEPTTLDQRIAIGMTEARARECRHLANHFLIKFGDHDVVKRFAQELRERSFELENWSNEMAKKYPPEVELAAEHRQGESLVRLQ